MDMDKHGKVKCAKSSKEHIHKASWDAWPLQHRPTTTFHVKLVLIVPIHTGMAKLIYLGGWLLTKMVTQPNMIS